MSDLIKRSDAIKAIDDVFDGIPMEQTYEILKVRKIIRELSSADRPQGEWLKFGLGRGTRILFCTNCERKIEVPLLQGDSNYDFCPNCGARMDKERKGKCKECWYWSEVYKRCENKCGCQFKPYEDHKESE